MIAAPDAIADERVYEPRGGALEMMRARDKIVCYEGPAGTGKTTAVLTKAFIYASKYAGARIVLLRNERASMTQSVLVSWERDVVPEGHPCLRGPKKSHRQEYEFPNGSVVCVGGLDNSDRIMSTEWGFAGVFEATEVSEYDYSQLVSRMRHYAAPYVQVVLDLNPGHPEHWINKAAKRGEMRRITSRHQDNPVFWDRDSQSWTRIGEEYIEGTLKSLRGHARARLLEGRWAAAEGACFDRFRRDANVLPRNGPWDQAFIAIDDGSSNPFVALLVMVDYDGRMHVKREVYAPGMITTTKIRAVESMAEESGMHPDIVIDAAAAQLSAELRNNGWNVCAPPKNVLDGIIAVNTRMADGPDGEPRLTISPECEKTIGEWESYRWKKSRHGEPIDQPVKENDHACDAIRYLVSHYDAMVSPAIHAPDAGIFGGGEDDEWD